VKLRRRHVLVALAATMAGLAARSQQRLNTAMHASACERLATLAERIAKCHVQVAQGVLAERSRRALRDSEREFDSLLPHVGRRARDAERRHTHVLLELVL
jgi:hypothetical protein